MSKKILLLSLVLLAINSNLVYSKPGTGTSMFALQSPEQDKVRIGKKLEMFVGMGYYDPSLKKWNEGIEKFNETLASMGITSQSEKVDYLEGQYFYNFGIKYYFNEHLSLALSVGQFNADVSSNYFLEYTTKEPYWPSRNIHETHYLKNEQNIRINPTLLTLSYNIPFYPLKEMLSFYIGSGLGYYFSSIKNDLYWDYEAVYSGGKRADSDSTYVISTNLLANIQTNINPLGYHFLIGCNIGFSIVRINLEAGYNFAKTEINEKDWTYFTRKETKILDFPMLFEIPEEVLDDVRYDDPTAKSKKKTLDLSGIIFKIGIGLSF